MVYNAIRRRVTNPFRHFHYFHVTDQNLINDDQILSSAFRVFSMRYPR